MKSEDSWVRYLFREWMLGVSALGLVVTSLYATHLPHLAASELQVLFLLWVLFVASGGLARTGLLERISRAMERGRFASSKLVLATFLLSMVATNDVALVVLVPLTLASNLPRRDAVVILQAFAANAGSALTPIGNPQNLFIFWYFQIAPLDFITSIAPFSLLMFGVLAAGSMALERQSSTSKHEVETVAPPRKKISPREWTAMALLLFAILIVLRVLPLSLGAVVVSGTLVLDRRALRVDYGLLLTFVCLFGLTENLRGLLDSYLEHPAHTFLFSALTSQVVSNVPAALIFAKFTSHWEALLWGTNVGGFGSLLASLSNLIAYKLFIRGKNRQQTLSFTLRFLGAGYLLFILGVVFYWFR